MHVSTAFRPFSSISSRNASIHVGLLRADAAQTDMPWVGKFMQHTPSAMHNDGKAGRDEHVAYAHLLETSANQHARAYLCGSEEGEQAIAETDDEENDLDMVGWGQRGCCTEHNGANIRHQETHGALAVVALQT
jgi:hypothetical protein